MTENLNDQQRLTFARERYERAAHAVQTGVKFELSNLGTQDTAPASPKHLRTGLDMRAADHAGLVKLLLAKGVFTEVEYAEAMADAAEAEKARYEQHLKDRFGLSINLL